ncbi:MAG: right-handed parallel beta-helix repeat-containing protein [Thermoplasmata archaeon]|nr:MAG: right-handed parallel beta-helix repeat-containing protein [Thermoplasmata archaeon]
MDKRIISVIIVVLIIIALINIVELPLTQANIEINTELELEGDGIYSGYYVNSTGNILIIKILDIDTNEDMSDAYVNITSTEPGINFTDDFGNNNDNPYHTGAGDYLREWGGGGTNQFVFVFDVNNSCPLGDHIAVLSIDYDTSAPSPRRYGVTQEITIVIDPIGKTLYVGGSGPGNYTHIQWAIENASDGYTVFVYDDSSPYFENVVIDKSINLIGENRDTTIIDGGNSEDVVIVHADWVDISGFSVRNSGIGSYPDYYAGIELNNVAYCKIINNNVSHNMKGIFLNSSSNNNITNNIILLNDYDSIGLLSSSNNNILNNTILDNEGGIYLGNSSNNTIFSNIISKVADGIHLSISSYNYIMNNNISNNSRGIFLGSSSNNIIANNNVTMSDDYGIDLGTSYNNTIINNNVITNVGGVRLISSSNNTITGNNVTNSMFGIHIESSTYNYIKHNIVMEGWEYDITLESSSNNTIINNNISDGKYGIYLSSSQNITITNNNIFSNFMIGIYFISSSNNNIAGNNIYDNGVGILLTSSPDNEIENNNVLENGQGIDLGWASSNNNVTNNNVSSNNGYGILIGSSLNNNIISCNLSSNSQDAIHLYLSDFNTIKNCYISDGVNNGIHLDSSHQNSIVSCNLSQNSQTALQMDFSDNNKIINSNIVNGWSNGVFLAFSSNNNFTNCEISNNDDGIEIYAFSNYTCITNCNISSNDNRGVFFSESSNNTLTDSQIDFNTDGVGFSSPSINNLVRNCSITNNNNDGIRIYEDNPDNNTILNNTIDSNNRNGIFVHNSFNNTISGNDISNNFYGLNISLSTDSKIYHNNIIDNTIQALDKTDTNIWNDSYPSGGNYWSDWTSPDTMSGPLQNIPGSDGIVDNPYVIDTDSQDYYPLTSPTLPTAPTITNMQPPGSSTTNNSRPTISADYSSGSGINTSSVVLKVDDIVVTSSASITGTNVTYIPSSPLLEGPHTVYLEVKDMAYNTAVASWSFYVDNMPPSPITDLDSSNQTSDCITLTWTAPGDDGDSGVASGYIVKYSSLGPITNSNWISATTYDQSWTPLSANETETYNISGLNPDTVYWFAIKAYDEANNYAYISNSPSFTTDTIPAALQNLNAITGDGCVNLTWEVPLDDGGSPIIGYNIYRNGTPGIFGTVSEGQLWFNDTNAVNGITYTYDITAFNIVGEGPNSSISATPMTVPSAPLNLNSIAGDSFVNLTWEAPLDDGGSSIISFNIYRNDTSGVYDMIPSDQLWYNDTDVSNGMSYIYYISANNSVGEGPNSTGISAIPMSIPSAPQNLQSSAGDGYVYLTWEVPISNGGTVITDYLIYRGTTSGNETFLAEIGNLLFYNDTSVSNGVTYYYKVTAKNEVGEGVFSNEVSALPETTSITPGKPSDGESPWVWVLLLVVIAIIIIGLLYSFIIRKTKEEQPPE